MRLPVAFALDLPCSCSHNLVECGLCQITSLVLLKFSRIAYSFIVTLSSSVLNIRGDRKNW
ncbi:hypothetical protein OIU79_015698, partial [Salix purpurea]